MRALMHNPKLKRREVLFPDLLAILVRHIQKPLHSFDTTSRQFHDLISPQLRHFLARLRTLQWRKVKFHDLIAILVQQAL